MESIESSTPMFTITTTASGDTYLHSTSLPVRHIPTPPPPPPVMSFEPVSSAAPPVQPTPTPPSSTPSLKLTLPTWYKSGLLKVVSSFIFAFAAFVFFSVDMGDKDLQRYARRFRDSNNAISSCLGCLCLVQAVSAFYESWWTLTNKKLREFDMDKNAAHSFIGFLSLFFGALSSVFTLFGFINYLDSNEESEDYRVQLTIFKHLMFTVFCMTISVLLVTARNFVVSSAKAIIAFFYECAKMPYDIVSTLIEIPFEQKVEAIVEKKIV